MTDTMERISLISSRRALCIPTRSPMPSIIMRGPFPVELLRVGRQPYRTGGLSVSPNRLYRYRPT